MTDIWVVTNTNDGIVLAFASLELVEQSMRLTYSRARMPAEMERKVGWVEWADGTVARLVGVKHEVEHF